MGNPQVPLEQILTAGLISLTKDSMTGLQVCKVVGGCSASMMIRTRLGMKYSLIFSKSGFSFKLPVTIICFYFLSRENHTIKKKTKPV